MSDANAESGASHGEFITIPKAEYDSMRRTLEILEDEKALEMIEKSEEDIREGKTHTMEEVREELGI